MRAARPSLILWLRYAVGGRLPDRYRAWVLYDLTSRMWVFRHLSRVLVQHSVWLLLLFVPGPLSLRLSMVVLAVVVGVAFSVAFMEDAAERRLIKHGYPVGLNRAIREQVDPNDRAELAVRYAARFGVPRDSAS